MPAVTGPSPPPDTYPLENKRRGHLPPITSPGYYSPSPELGADRQTYRLQHFNASYT